MSTHSNYPLPPAPAGYDISKMLGVTPANPNEGLADYIIRLAETVMMGVEKGSLYGQALIFQARRLANAVSDKEAEDWLTWELDGYPTDHTGPVEAAAKKVGRLEAQQSYITVSYPRLIGLLESTDKAISYNDTRIKHRNPYRVSGGPKVDPAKWEDSKQKTYEKLIRYNEIVDRVRGEVHRYVSGIYHKFRFANLSYAVLDRHRIAVENLLNEVAPEVMDKLPSVYERLAISSPEAVSHALSSMRRMISAFADRVSPATPSTKVAEDGTEYKLTDQEVCNRILEYIKKHCGSQSRIERLNKSVRLLWGRCSAGVHSDVAPKEAQALLVHTIMTLGEIAELPAGTDS